MLPNIIRILPVLMALSAAHIGCVGNHWTRIFLKLYHQFRFLMSIKKISSPWFSFHNIRCHLKEFQRNDANNFCSVFIAKKDDLKKKWNDIRPTQLDFCSTDYLMNRHKTDVRFDFDSYFRKLSREFNDISFELNVLCFSLSNDLLNSFIWNIYLRETSQNVRNSIDFFKKFLKK